MGKKEKTLAKQMLNNFKSNNPVDIFIGDYTINNDITIFTDNIKKEYFIAYNVLLIKMWGKDYINFIINKVDMYHHVFIANNIKNYKDVDQIISFLDKFKLKELKTVGI